MGPKTRGGPVSDRIFAVLFVRKDLAHRLWIVSALKGSSCLLYNIALAMVPPAETPPYRV